MLNTTNELLKPVVKTYILRHYFEDTLNVVSLNFCDVLPLLVLYLFYARTDSKIQKTVTNSKKKQNIINLFIKQ